MSWDEYPPSAGNWDVGSHTPYRPSTRNPLYVRNRMEELRAREEPHIDRRYVVAHIRQLYRRLQVLEEEIGRAHV